MKNILYAIIISTFVITITSCDQSKYRLSTLWPYVDVSSDNGNDPRDMYRFKEDGSVIINAEKVGIYKKDGKEIEIIFDKKFKNLNRVKGRVDSPTRIYLLYPKQEHELRLAKG